MQHTQTSTLITEKAATAPAVAHIPKLDHAEAVKLAAAELQRFLTVLESLEGADWQQPTACTLWTVKDIAAHEAGSLRGNTSFRAFWKMQSKEVTGPYRERGMSLLDAMNQAMVDSRANRSPDDVIAEIRDMGPRAVAWRAGLPALVRAIRLPLEDLGGWRPIGYLMDTIYSRDMWMHRIDICRATRRAFVQTADHDGRIVALIVRDFGTQFLPDLDGQSIVLDLTGEAGGTWLVGTARVPAATIRMNALDFSVLASGRVTAADVMAQSLVQMEGDRALAQRVLETTSVPF